LYVALGFMLWSGVIELVQPYVNRYAEWLDLLANVVGVVGGVLTGSIARRFNSLGY
jgi:VanZ family protein